MLSRLIAHGNTYCGKTGLPRTVVEMFHDSWGSDYVKYKRADGTTGGCYIGSFASWATGFYTADPEATPETLKRLLRIVFPIAWKSDRGRQDPDLMAAYVEVQKVLGLTKEDVEEMSK